MMNIEIEAKLRLHDPAAMHQKLVELDAVLDRRIHETNTYFDLPDGQLKSSDQGLRIRLERDLATDQTQTVITHKGPRTHGQFKSRSETETNVENAKSAAALLSALGYHSVLTFEKERTRYLLGDCRVEIDTLPYLGTFIEIEGDRDQQVHDILERLDLVGQPIIRASYIAMLLTYLKEQGMNQTTVRLEATAQT